MDRDAPARAAAADGARPGAGVELALAAGDEIRTELSCKYTRDSFAARLAGTGLALERWITDPAGLFASALLRRSVTLERLQQAWQRSDRLFGLLADEAWLEQPIALRQPFLFYLGHLPAFAWNQLGRGLLGLAPASGPDFDALFERGIDPVGVDAYVPRAAWPERAAVLDYRDRVARRARGRPCRDPGFPRGGRARSSRWSSSTS